MSITTAPRPSAPRHAHASVRRTWQFPRLAMVVSILALIGVLIFMYPSVANWLSQLEQARVIASVGGAEQQETPTQLSDELARAQAYNDDLVGGALLAENARVPQGTGVASGNGDYADLLRADADGAMGRLRIPKINVDLPIYHGTDDATLAKGVGHLEGTSLPIGGESQHSVLTAHRGLASSELFTHLDRLAVGDTFTIEVFGQVLTYRVATTEVVEPEDTASLFPEYGKDLVTLVTCTPLGINTHRILVTAERVTPTPQADLDRAGSASDQPGFPWWAVGLAATVLLLGSYVYRSGIHTSEVPSDSRSQTGVADGLPLSAAPPPAGAPSSAYPLPRSDGHPRPAEPGAPPL